MIILTLRTDNPDAEIGLYDSNKQLAYETWQADRQLAETLHLKIKEILESTEYDYSDVNGIICYKGPGSFTGLRIGITVANALAYALKIPIIGEQSESWIKSGIVKILNGNNDVTIVPYYGAAPHITQQKK